MWNSLQQLQHLMSMEHAHSGRTPVRLRMRAATRIAITAEMWTLLMPPERDADLLARETRPLLALVATTHNDSYVPVVEDETTPTLAVMLEYPDGRNLILGLTSLV